MMVLLVLLMPAAWAVGDGILDDPAESGGGLDDGTAQRSSLSERKEEIWRRVQNAAPYNPAETIGDAVGADKLNEAAGAYLDQYLNLREVTGEDYAAGVRSLLAGSRGDAAGALRGAVRSGVLLLTVAMLCGMAESVREELGGNSLDPVRLAGATAVTVIAVADVGSLMGLGKRALEGMDTFAKVLLPTVTAACAAAGMPASSAARQGATLLFLNLLMTVVNRFLLPLVYAYVAASTAGAALGNDGLKRLAGLIKWGCTGLLSLLLTCFVFYLTLSGAVGRSADAVAQKAAKTALNGMVPVVGGVLADAAETVIAGAGVLKGTVGVIGLLAVLAICLGPFLHLGCHYLVYKLAAALTATVTTGPTAGLIDSLGSAFALVLGMAGGEAFILYVALITSIKAVSG